jgi:hypothetical protein
VACLSISFFRRAVRFQGAAARRGRAAAFLAVLVFAELAVSLLAGCDQSGIGYANDQYRFSLSYDASLAPAAHARPSVLTGSEPAYVVAFLDPAAPKAGGHYVDDVWVAVMRLPAGAHWPEAPAMAVDLRQSVAAALANGLSGSVTRPTTQKTNGRASWAVGYEYRLGGTAVRAVTYVLVNGAYEYQVTLQAAGARWAQMLPRLTRSIDSFAVR